MRDILNDLGISDEHLVEAIGRIEYQHYQWTPMSYVHGVLRRLSKRYRLGIISNGMTDSAIHVLKEMRLFSRFETVVLSRDVGFRKPHPVIFNYALEAMKVSPFEAVFVGDSMGADAMGARRVGMSAVWISRGEDVHEVESSGDPFLVRISNLEEVPEAIRRLEGLQGSGRLPGRAPGSEAIPANLLRSSR
jgi:HAD superfamily hydrolase (TIGR01549 family)